VTRHDGRRPDQLRELDLQPDFLEQPHGSILYAQGRTVVLCTATIDEDIPRWLRGKGQGWMTAEYSLLPASTGERKRRDPVEHFLWLADIQEGRRENLYLTDMHYRPVLAEQIADRISAALRERGLLACQPAAP